MNWHDCPTCGCDCHDTNHGCPGCEADAEIAELKADNARLVKAFSHTFVMNRDNDTGELDLDVDRCKVCGLDIRNDVHPRIPRDEWNRWGC